ncbi:MAG: phosphoglucomutase (alpha-D-glucose-1,6-bisphosphate-dependent) [Synergistaceae bacterium]|nr:phosphoglucomutase (alpha-D-glucose-1,6-bisphosphate-dependent) [Synergistaceae bacterium]
MGISPYAGKIAPQHLLTNIPRLISSYYTQIPDTDDPTNLVSFGTSGHRGSSLSNSFNEQHILAIAQAITEYRKGVNITGPLFIGMDTHALSEPAMRTCIEVFAAAGVECVIQAPQIEADPSDIGYTPTPVISHAILAWNKKQAKDKGESDGIVITPSHNPPEDGGIKYNPPHGGPASPETTKAIQTRANELIRSGISSVKRIPFKRALKALTTRAYDYVIPYVNDLKNVIDMEIIRNSDLKIGVDPMGGSGLAYWEPISSIYGLKNLVVVNKRIDPAFGFMSVDKDGKIRMDCSSPYAMAGLLDMKNNYDISFGNDTDFDRHGIVTPEGLMNPNAYLAVAIKYLFTNREWDRNCKIGKTLVSSSMINRVAKGIEREVCEVPVGFKWFVDGLLDGSFGFGGEESAGASFLRRNGTVWTTDKDGIIMDLLAAELTAHTGKNPAQHYKELVSLYGEPFYARMDAPAAPEQKSKLSKLSPEAVKADNLAGEVITAKLTNAPGNNAPIDGLKVETQNGWFAARPSGTENVYKIYAESFISEKHLKMIQSEAQEIVNEAIS